MTEKKTSFRVLLARFEDGILMLILVGMVLLAFAQILLRNIFGIGLVWIDPLVRQMLLWVTLVGAMIATRDHKHITVDAISRYLPPGRIKCATGFICDAFATIICSLLTYSTFLVFQMEFQDPVGGQIMTGLPLWASLLTLPVAFGVMTFRLLRFSIYSFLCTVKGDTE
jgi:TRAP-type C4-dicarboxylate transport system permease small subunit